MVLLALVALLVLGAFQVVSGRWRVAPILSGSMRPGFAVGGVVLAQRVPIRDLKVRDVVIFHPPGLPNEQTVHRIVSLKVGPTGPIIQTRGDNNPENDPWTVTLRGATAYRARYTLPMIGYAALWLHQPATRRATLAAGLIGLLIAVGLAATGGMRRRKGEEGGPGPRIASDIRKPVRGRVPLVARALFGSTPRVPGRPPESGPKAAESERISQ